MAVRIWVAWMAELILLFTRALLLDMPSVAFWGFSQTNENWALDGSQPVRI